MRYPCPLCNEQGPSHPSTIDGRTIRQRAERQRNRRRRRIQFGEQLGGANSRGIIPKQEPRLLTAALEQPTTESKSLSIGLRIDLSDGFRKAIPKQAQGPYDFI